MHLGTPIEAKSSALSAYNAAATDFYNHAVNTFWDRAGEKTVARLQLSAGDKVLDVCCGSGASALPAARAVGPGGSVLGIDLAEHMIEVSRVRADDAGLDNIEFRVGDMMDLDLPPSSFDAVVCVFGIFFVPDMTEAVRTLWKLVRPNGRLAITTWGPSFFEPASTAFWDAVRQERPDLDRRFNPWDRISEPDALRELFTSAGVDAPEIKPEARLHCLHEPEDWWPMVLGTGYRGTIEQLDAAQRERVRERCLAYIRDHEVGAVDANVLYGHATKPGT